MLKVRELYRIPVTSNLSLIRGDIFFSRMQTLTIPVNTMGIMGKGLALSAKHQFPDVYEKYKDLCRSNILKMGKPYLYKRESSLNFSLAGGAERITCFLIFPTKTDWRNKSDLKGIEEGLKWLVMQYKTEGIKSLAIPALGCGLGGLQWDTVAPVLCTYLNKLNIPVNLYLPVDKEIPEEQLKPDFLLKKGI